LPRTIIISHVEERGRGPGLGELLKFWRFPYIKAELANDFKFGTQLGFAKVHHKITLLGKSGCGLGLRELPEILGFPYNICNG